MTGTSSGGRPPRRSPLAPAAIPRRLSENLWVFEDTANVYVVRDGDHAVLVDFGSGAILDHLPGLGITTVDWILHTHHHRDQCQGDALAVERGIPIAAPAHERHLFEDAEDHWRGRRVFHLYDLRNDFNAPTADIPVAASLVDYETFRAGAIDFLVLPSPGHTMGSVTLLADVDGLRVAFSGDLMYAPGKLVTLHDTQVTYGAFGGHEGVDLGAHSLAALAKHEPALLCPSHGDPIRDPAEAIATTSRRLAEFVRFEGGTPLIDHRPYALSPHLIVSHQSCSTFYAVVADSGRALLVDYGSPSFGSFGAFEKSTGTGDRMRFVEHTLDRLRDDFGVRSIDLVLPSHMHDDHINGIPHLARHFGTEVWALDLVADVLEDPRAGNLGCTLGEPIAVDRRLRPGERFGWEGFEFEIDHSPGHTEYQGALYTTIDGTRVCFSGDAFFDWGRPVLAHSIVYRNHIENDSHAKSIRRMIEHAPELLCPGHEKPFPVTPERLAVTEDGIREERRFFFDLLPDGRVDQGLNPSWIRIQPYQPLVVPGVPLDLEIHARNYGDAPLEVEAALALPAGLVAEPVVARFTVPPHADGSAALRVTVPERWRPTRRRFAIAADVRAGGRYLGQVTEAVCELARVGDIAPVASRGPADA